MLFAPTVATEIKKMLLPRWGEFMLCAALPRAVPTADGVCTFRAQISAKRGEWKCA